MAEDRTFLAKVERATRWRRNQMLRPMRWLAYESGQPKLVLPPDRLYIESTNICNLSCIMCPTPAWCGYKPVSTQARVGQHRAVL